jgi:hypothetical protein
MHSVWPSVCGWKEVERRILTLLSMEDRADQKREVKMDPRSETRESEMPCSPIILSKK